MKATYQRHLKQLQNECVKPAFLGDLFGTKWPPGQGFSDDFAKWQKHRGAQDRCPEGQFSRWATELFLQDHRLQPLTWTAASLGMTPPSLRAVLDRLPTAGLRRNYELYPDLLDKSLEDDLLRCLNGLRFRTFGTHNSFWRALHKAVGEATGAEIEPWYCQTSLELSDFEPQLAWTIDSITLEGLSVQHSVWLDLGKPVRLAPDRCSKLFYAENRDDLRNLLAGTGEPEDIGSYLDLIGTPRMATRA